MSCSTRYGTVVSRTVVAVGPTTSTQIVTLPASTSVSVATIIASVCPNNGRKRAIDPYETSDSSESQDDSSESQSESESDAATETKSETDGLQSTATATGECYESTSYSTRYVTIAGTTSVSYVTQQAYSTSYLTTSTPVATVCASSTTSSYADESSSDYESSTDTTSSYDYESSYDYDSSSTLSASNQTDVMSSTASLSSDTTLSSTSSTTSSATTTSSVANPTALSTSYVVVTASDGTLSTSAAAEVMVDSTQGSSHSSHTAVIAGSVVGSLLGAALLLLLLICGCNHRRAIRNRFGTVRGIKDDDFNDNMWSPQDYEEVDDEVAHGADIGAASDGTVASRRPSTTSKHSRTGVYMPREDHLMREHRQRLSEHSQEDMMGTRAPVIQSIAPTAMAAPTLRPQPTTMNRNYRQSAASSTYSTPDSVVDEYYQRPSSIYGSRPTWQTHMPRRSNSASGASQSYGSTEGPDPMLYRASSTPGPGYQPQSWNGQKRGQSFDPFRANSIDSTSHVLSNPGFTRLEVVGESNDHLETFMDEPEQLANYNVHPTDPTRPSWAA